MLSKAYTVALLVAVLGGSAEAGHVRRGGHIHRKRADICGTRGYDFDQGNYFYDSGGKLNSYAACSAKCAGDPQCLSFAYGKKTCMLFNIPLDGNFGADDSSSDVYYDRGCISAPAKGNNPTTTTTTTTSKSSTTTVTKASSSTPTSPAAAAAAPSNTPKSSSSSTSNTAAVATVPSAAVGAASTPSTTTSAAPDFPTANPYESKGCPMPKAIAIAELRSSTDSRTGTTSLASVKIQYGNGTFTCPGAGRCASSAGSFSCRCDSSNLLNVNSDGRSWIQVQEWYWCDAQEQRPNKAYQTLALTLNFTMLADYVSCSTAGANTTCTQSRPLLAPVGGYGGGGTPAFNPMDVNGNDLPNCPVRPGHSQIVTDTAACATPTAKA
ncbi:hypothetical protein KVR01_004461 [Diaporthe batatas]|uniref:uncharacterized protein n=1 Tax=Diaporthe batatas TaxID=748121 RepID=UPI001D05113C|nr:uncharacterized protein KVR01_004461 [Diaporthe batatas]KAG8165909.1 hypothetical protein KVR01_004461 [Diaporthe batatas]